MQNIAFKISLLLLFISSAVMLHAQEHKISKSTGKLYIEGINNIEIEGYDGKEIVISTDYNKDDSDRAAGLSAINAMGLRDNTGLGLNVKEEGDKIKIRTIKKSKGKYVIKIPKTMAVSFKHTNYNMKKLYIHGLTGEVEASLQYGSVSLENVTGPLSINTVYGSIEAKFSTLSPKNPTSLYSVYQFVDVTIPASSKANVHLSAGYGDMFTDFDINVDANGKLSSSRVEGKINGGGTELRVNSSYKNVYLRKG